MAPSKMNYQLPQKASLEAFLYHIFHRSLPGMNLGFYSLSSTMLVPLSPGSWSPLQGLLQEHLQVHIQDSATTMHILQWETEYKEWTTIAHIIPSVVSVVREDMSPLTKKLLKLATFGSYNHGHDRIIAAEVLVLLGKHTRLFYSSGNSVPRIGPKTR